MTTEIKHIRKLDKLTSNQIAAGEVIERPCSVVKELVENSIDAGATKIVVEITGGGLTKIKITDNGHGILRDDLPLAVESHATSKLITIEDLNNLNTLGFRGEALASIASVASVKIKTRTTDESAGSVLFKKGADEKPVVTGAASAVGCEITVEDLFFNTPARLKFMKSPSYEGGLIHDVLIQMCLGYPSIDFVFINENKKIIDTVGINTVSDLIGEFYGADAINALCEVKGEASTADITGYITAPPYSRGTRKAIHVFINGRRISIKDIQWSIDKAFEFLLPRGRFPVAILNIKMPGDLLDVNVHPGKLEVRINDKGLYSSLTHLLKLAISGGQTMPDADKLGGIAGTKVDHRTYEAPKLFSDNTENNQVRNWKEIYSFTAEQERSLDNILMDNEAEKECTGYCDNCEMSSSFNDELLSKSPAATKEQYGCDVHNRELLKIAQQVNPEDFIFGPDIKYKVIGQLHETFILAEVDAGLLILDQHVVHERIIYEQLIEKEQERRLKAKKAQMLAIPVRVNLTLSEEDILIKNIMKLNDLGIILERFGQREYLIRSTPAGEKPMDENMFKDLLFQISENASNVESEDIRNRLLVMMSCKAAVKANTPLTTEEMVSLLEGLKKTTNPMTCPHGRPIMYLLAFNKMLRAFGRVL